MYSAYKLHKQGDNIQPWYTPFPIWNQSIVPCLLLTVACWPAYRFLRRQARWSGILISLRIFQFVVIHIVKCVVSEAEVDVFLELSCFFYDPLCVLSHFSCADSLWPMDCSSPGSSVHRTFQAGLVDQVAISYSKRPSWPRDWTHFSCTGRNFVKCVALNFDCMDHNKLWKIL